MPYPDVDRADCCGEERELADLECVGDAPDGAYGRRDLLECRPGKGCNGLLRALGDVRRAFEPRRQRDGIVSLPPDFWLDMLQRQLDEAHDHLATSKAYHAKGDTAKAVHFRNKALAEIADCFSVGWQALQDNTGEQAEAFIVGRIRTRIIPRVDELADRDLPKVRELQGCPCDGVGSCEKAVVHGG